jgi:hypothetical protein
MEENLTRYESLRKKHDILFEYVYNCKSKLNKNREDLEAKSQYRLFNGQLNEVRKELRLYDKIKKYVKEGNYKRVSEMSLDNSNLKEILSKSDLVSLTNYYEENLKKIIVKNKNLKLVKKSLEKTLEDKE